MVVRFLLDNQQKEENEILRNIDLYTKKDPYPDKHTEHLATFLKSCFQIELDKKLNKVRREDEAKTAIRKRRILEIKRREEIRKIRELEAIAPAAPIPQVQKPQVKQLPELPTLQEEEIKEKYEYVLNLYGYPVGILVEKDEQGNYSFRHFEPIVDQEIIQHIEKKFGEKIGNDLSVLDDNTFIQEVAYKAAEKLKLKISVDDLPKIKYYLKRDAMGANKIDILIYDEKINEIFTEGDKFTVVNYSNIGELHTNIRISETELKNLIFRIARVNQITIDETNPVMDIPFQGFNIHARIGKSSMMILKRM